MELKNQVVNLDLAKRMKELGFEQESYFYWANVKIENSLKEYQEIFHGQIRCGEPMEYIASAYTVAELGEMIEGNCFSYKDDDGDWTCQYSEVRGLEDDLSNNEKADTEANARAKCLIFLVENGIIKI